MRALLLALLAAVSTAAAAQQPVKLKFSIFSNDRERIYNAVAKPFAENVNREGKGVVEVEVYPNGALGRNPAQQAQMVLDGVADLAFIVPPFTPGRFPESEVLELPGLFNDLREGTLVYTRLVAAGTIKDFGQYFPVALWATPPFSLHLNFPLKSLADLKGKKIRASGVMQIEALKSLGVVPVGMPPTEVPEAIARRTVDGATSQPSVVFDFGYDRVTSTHYFMRLGEVPLVVLMNRKKFESLPPAGQAAIRKFSGEWMAKVYSDEITEYNAQLVKRLESDPKRRVLYPTEADEARIAKAFAPVVDAWVNRSPRHAELYNAAKAELAKVRAGK